jgi:sugar/nucleoside kinase (ribokinase family)
MKLNVYSFGSALVDIQVQVDDEIFQELGLEKGNMYLTERSRQEQVLKRLLGSDELSLDCISKQLKTAAGGSAANTVYGIVQLGGTAGLCGAVADDAFGALYRQDMDASGVQFTPRIANGVSGTCVVLISNDAQRTMLTCLGVSSELTPDDIDVQMLESSEYIYLEGYLFDSDSATETMQHAITLAKRAGVKVAFTASDAFCIDRHRDTFLKLINGDVDLLFANAQEAQALTGASDTDAALRALGEMCAGVAVTDGDQGSTLRINGETVQVAPHKVAALDTTGAGDSYAAGLLYGLTNGCSLERSGEIASLFSARVVSLMGPRFTGNIREEVLTSV